MTQVESNKEILNEASDCMEAVQNITDIISCIKDKQLDKIGFMNETNSNEAYIDITDENRDFIIQMMNNLRLHMKSLATSKIGSVSTNIQKM
ncbi:MAG: hypothetical protein IJ193_00210 [Bacilli bacterium]|nr:hypothetical protein [Bacilli bacterium]